MPSAVEVVITYKLIVLGLGVALQGNRLEDYTIEYNSGMWTKIERKVGSGRKDDEQTGAQLVKFSR